MILPLNVGAHTLAHLMEHIDMTPAEQNLFDIAATFCTPPKVRCPFCDGSGARVRDERNVLEWAVAHCTACKRAVEAK